MGLDTVEIVIDVEDKFDIKIPDDEVALITEVGEFVVYIINACEVQNGSKLEFDYVFTFLKQHMERNFDVPIDKVELSSKFVDDLGFG